MLYGDKNHPSKKDPVMVNPKGAQVQVPYDRVAEFLNKGFKLVDENWTPEPKRGPAPDPTAPYSRYKLEEELSEEEDKLEVTIV